MWPFQTEVNPFYYSCGMGAKGFIFWKNENKLLNVSPSFKMDEITGSNLFRCAWETAYRLNTPLSRVTEILFKENSALESLWDVNSQKRYAFFHQIGDIDPEVLHSLWFYISADPVLMEQTRLQRYSQKEFGRLQDIGRIRKLLSLAPEERQQEFEKLKRRAIRAMYVTAGTSEEELSKRLNRLEGGVKVSEKARLKEIERLKAISTCKIKEERKYAEEMKSSVHRALKSSKSFIQEAGELGIYLTEEDLARAKLADEMRTAVVRIAARRGFKVIERERERHPDIKWQELTVDEEFKQGKRKITTAGIAISVARDLFLNYFGVNLSYRKLVLDSFPRYPQEYMNIDHERAERVLAIYALPEYEGWGRWGPQIYILRNTSDKDLAEIISQVSVIFTGSREEYNQTMKGLGIDLTETAYKMAKNSLDNYLKPKEPEVPEELKKPLKKPRKKPQKIVFPKLQKKVIDVRKSKYRRLPYATGYNVGDWGYDARGNKRVVIEDPKLGLTWVTLPKKEQT